jgi:aspartate carbamoyltransferase regulatory subunit
MQKKFLTQRPTQVKERRPSFLKTGLGLVAITAFTVVIGLEIKREGPIDPVFNYYNGQCIAQHGQPTVCEEFAISMTEREKTDCKFDKVPFRDIKGER